MKYSKELHDYIQLFVKMNEEFPDDSLATVEETQALLDEIDRLQAELKVTQERCDRYEENMARHGLVPVAGAPESEG